MFFAGVGLILAEKTLEHLLFKRVRNTGAVIGNRQGDMIGSKGQCKGDMAGRRCVTEGIVHEDGEYLGDPFFVAENRRAFLLRQTDT